MRLATAAVLVVLVVAACSSGETTVATGGDVGSGADTAVAGQPGDPTSTAPPAPGDGSLTCWTAAPASGTEHLSWQDMTEPWGLLDPLTGMHVHAAAWGDVDGDTNFDLVVGTFATARSDVYAVRGAAGPAPDRLLLATGDGFVTDTAFPEMYGRTSGAVFADLDNDGDDDLVLSRNTRSRDGAAATSAVLENQGGTFAAVDSGLDPALGGRSVGVLDVDQDGLLDMIVIEDRYRGGSSRLYRNLGNLRFEDAGPDLGFPAGVDGLGIATGDLNNDRITDVFVAGANRLFVGTGSGLEEMEGAQFEWPTFGPEDDVSGAAIADVNRDGWLDLVVGHHYNSTLSQRIAVPVRLYLNRTETPGAAPRLEDVTEAAGLTGIPTKAPHVEIADLDNDGWPEILTSASAASGTNPAVFRHQGLDAGVPRFAAPDGMGDAQYWVGAPTADIDRDGRLDVVLLEWEPSLPSRALHNTVTSGNWIEVSVDPSLGGGIGTRVDVYAADAAGQPGALLGSREIVASLGYTTGVPRIAHFGLGDAAEVDVVVTPPLPHEPITLASVAANQHLQLPAGCG